MALSMEASGILTAKEAGEPVAFLSEKAMEVLLQQSDGSTRIGLRDICFMATMYDTVARDCEMLNLRLNSLDLNEGCPKVRLEGKGNKIGQVPLMKKTASQLKATSVYSTPRIQKKEEWLFFTVTHGIRNKMSDDNVVRFLKNIKLWQKQNMKKYQPK